MCVCVYSIYNLLGLYDVFRAEYFVLGKQMVYSREGCCSSSQHSLLVGSICVWGYGLVSFPPPT